VSLVGEDDFQPRQVRVEQHVEEQWRFARHPRVDRGASQSGFPIASFGSARARVS
jgi:hypothetical protein